MGQEVAKITEFPEISIHAISGSPSPNTMRLVGMIQRQVVVILVDSRSTHNFSDPSIVKKARMLMVTTEKITVKVANGDKLQSEGKCTPVTVKVQGKKLSTNFYVLTLGGCDMVLRVQWLRTLGPILWDFLKMTMAFSHLGNKVLLYGLSPTELTVEEGNKFFRPSISENRAVVLQLLSQSDVLPSKTENEVIQTVRSV